MKFIRQNFFDKVKFSIRSQSLIPTSTSANTSETSETETEAAPKDGEWKERLEAEQALFAYLLEMPSTVAVLHGPQGSGKSKMLIEVLRRCDTLAHSSGARPRKTLEIDCAEIYKSGTDAGLLTSLAKQTGYWPMFSFLSSMNNLIDLASVGLIGQKAGFSTTVDAQMKEVLEVTGGALKQVRPKCYLRYVKGVLTLKRRYRTT